MLPAQAGCFPNTKEGYEEYKAHAFRDQTAGSNSWLGVLEGNLDVLTLEYVQGRTGESW